MKKISNYHRKQAEKFWDETWIGLFGAFTFKEIVTERLVQEAKSNRRYKRFRACTFEALYHLYHAKFITYQQRQSMKSMLSSSDSENIYVAISIIAQFKPENFHHD